MSSVTTHLNATMCSCPPPSLLVLSQWPLQEIDSAQKDPGRQFHGEVVWKVLRMYSSSRRSSLSPDPGLRPCWSPSANPGSLAHSLTRPQTCTPRKGQVEPCPGALSLHGRNAAAKPATLGGLHSPHSERQGSFHKAR